MFRKLDPRRPRRVEAVAEIHLPARGLLDLGMAMAEHEWAVRAHVVDVLVAIDVPDVRTLAARKERGVGALGQHQGSLMAVDTAGNNFLGALHQRFAFLECVGFHGNSCVMIFAFHCNAGASASSADRQRESYLPAQGSSLQKSNGPRVLTTHSPQNYAIGIWSVAIRGVARALRERQRSHAYQLVAQLGARQRLAQDGRGAELIALGYVAIVERAGDNEHRNRRQRLVRTSRLQYREAAVVRQA